MFTGKRTIQMMTLYTSPHTYRLLLCFLAIVFGHLQDWPVSCLSKTGRISFGRIWRLSFSASKRGTKSLVSHGYMRYIACRTSLSGGNIYWLGPNRHTHRRLRINLSRMYIYFIGAAYIELELKSRLADVLKVDWNMISGTHLSDVTRSKPGKRTKSNIGAQE